MQPEPAPSPEPAAHAGRPLERAAPLAKIGAALILMGVLFASVDIVTPAIVLGALLLAIPFGGMRFGTLALRAWPVLATAVAVAVVNALLAPEQGRPWLVMGPVVIGSQAAVTGAALAIRLVAIALAGVVAVASTEPIDLADALVQQAYVSPRFAVGALAAVRLLPVLVEERRTLALARRARGMEASWPFGALRVAASTLFGLLAAAIRRAVRLALAMEARGFGARDCRTVGRPQRFGASDRALLAAAAATGAVAVAVSVALGTWRFFIG